MGTIKDKILVVEGRESGNAIEKILKGERFRVYRATSIPESLSVLLQENIDVIVLAGNNSEVDTLKLCKLIKSHGELKETPVIFVAEKNDKNAILNAYENGANDFISLPVSNDAIIDKVELHMSLKDRQESIISKYQQNQKEFKILNFEMDRLKKEYITLKDKHIKPDQRALQSLEVELLKNKFLRILVQEIRTPVSAIIGFTDILKDDMRGSENQHFIESICSASRKTRELLDTALIVTEIDPGKSADSMRPYKLSNLIEYAVKDYEELIAEKNIHIAFPEDKEITEIIIDPGLIKEVLKVFILKALKHTSEYGNIILDVHESVDKIELHIHGPSGNRMPAEKLEKLSAFLSFPGMLGHNEWPEIRIALAKFIMNLHNAQIKIENSNKGGVLVKLVFPVNNEKSEELHQILSQLN